jgi:hypothetical protein
MTYIRYHTWVNGVKQDCKCEECKQQEEDMASVKILRMRNGQLTEMTDQECKQTVLTLDGLVDNGAINVSGDSVAITPPPIPKEYCVKTGTKHEWVTVEGILNNFKNCKNCDAKWEDVFDK